MNTFKLFDIGKTLIIHCNLSNLIYYWNTNNEIDKLGDGPDIYFQITNFDSIYNFKFLVTCYSSGYCYELTRNGPWKKFIPLALVSVDDNNKSSLFLSGDLTVNGIINGTTSAGINIGNFNIIENVIRNRYDSKYLELKGGTSDTNSARLMLFSTERQDTNIGNFYLCARSSTEIIKLEGKPDGRLTWDNNDLGSTAIVSKTLAENGYIRFASGLTIQWLEDYNFPDLTARSFPITWPSNHLFTVIGTVRTTRYHNGDKQVINAETNFIYSLTLASRGNANEYLGRVTKMKLTTSELSIVTDIRCAIFALGE